MSALLNWTSEHVLATVLFLASAVFWALWLRSSLEMRRFQRWLADPNNEWEQLLEAIRKLQRRDGGA